MWNFQKIVDCWFGNPFASLSLLVGPQSTLRSLLPYALMTMTMITNTHLGRTATTTAFPYRFDLDPMMMMMTMMILMMMLMIFPTIPQRFLWLTPLMTMMMMMMMMLDDAINRAQRRPRWKTMKKATLFTEQETSCKIDVCEYRLI